MATRPARQMMIAMTVAKIGRSMKNLENTDPGLLYWAPWTASAFDGGLPAAAAAGLAYSGFVETVMPGRSVRPPSTTTCSPLLQPFEDEPVVPVPFADHHGPLFDFALLAHDPDKMALGTLLHRPLGHQDRLRPDGAFQAGPDILVRAQYPVGIVDAGADEESPGLGVIGRFGKGHLPCMKG